MSLGTFDSEIRRFLTSSEPQVLIISGKWGVGKTFAWNKLLREVRDAGSIQFDRYAYVSLFGLGSLEDVKGAVFQNTVGRERAGDPADISTLDGALKSATSGWRQGFSFIRSAMADYAAVMDKIGFFTVRNQIVCIDDLERKSRSLDIRDILGLISFLREQRGCKIVILLNDAQLGDEEAEFRTQLEKVSDTAVQFEPTPEEAAKIGVDPQTPFAEAFATHCMTLGIVNIRTIKKIERSALRLMEALEKYDPRVFSQALSSVTLFQFAKLQPGEAPTLDFIRSTNPYEAVLAHDNQPLPNPEWRSLLQSYGFSHCDELDAVIMRGIERGHYDTAQLDAEALKLEEQFKRRDEDNSFSEAWDVYHDSFDDNAEEVLRRIVAAITATPNSITPNNLSGSIRLLKDLGWSGDISALIRNYVESRQAGRDFWNLADQPFGDDVTDPDVRAAFDAKLATFEETRDATAILLELGKGNGWSRSDLAFLATQSAETFYSIFKAARGKELHRILRGALMFRNIQNPEPDMHAVTQYSVEALERIALESEINRRRVNQRAGIVVDSAPAGTPPDRSSDQ